MSRTIIVAIGTVALLLFPQAKEKPSMVAPTVSHHDETMTQHYDRVTVSCPDGYEGHFVDVGVGFDGTWNGGYVFGNEGAPGYTICFSKEFMDKIRANPELLRGRPVIRPA